MKKMTGALILAGAVLATGCATKETQTNWFMKSGEEGIPGPMREWRAAWVATVANIDWPTEPGLSTEEQQAEAIEILDAAVETNLNALVLQIRPHADALYPSEIEPWSYYLTGEQGKAPDPYYDPLEFWIDEAHDRGLELHVWFNPYRAMHPVQFSNAEISEDSVVKSKPQLVVKLGDNGYYWMDPAHPGTQQHSLDVVMDVVRRYEIDGVHFDDYFYPYASYNDGEDFPDDATWNDYVAGGGDLSRSDWRRKAVNDFIEGLYDAIKAEKPEVEFGLSPFGIWRPGHPRTIRGLDQYEALYADAKLWLNEGWVDYYTPQLYWPTDRLAQSYPLLLGWWQDQNHENRNLWPGVSISATGTDDPERGAEEVESTIEEIQITRGLVDTGYGPGNCMFSVKYLVRDNSGMATALKEGPYAQKALAPPSPWLDDEAPESPAIAVDGNLVSWEPVEDGFRYVVYMEANGDWDHAILNRNETSYTVPANVERVAVTAVDRSGNESEVMPVSR